MIVVSLFWSNLICANEVKHNATTPLEPHLGTHLDKNGSLVMNRHQGEAPDLASHCRCAHKGNGR
jgi:hypothetical protein